jgi:recombination protein RecT
MSDNTQVATAQPQSAVSVKPKDLIKGFFERDDVKKKFVEILGKRGNQFVASVLQLSLTDSNLSVATPASVYGSAMIAATLDLPVNKNLGYAWIIGYKNRQGVTEAQFQMGYKGFIQLALRSQQYEKINAIPVYENQFKKWNALTENLDADFDIDGEGKIVGYVSYFQLRNGFEKIVYWSRNKVEQHAKKYSKTYSFNNSTWKTDFDAMALKTVLKNTLDKWGILSVEMQQAMLSDQAVVIEKDGNLTNSYEDVPEFTVISKEEERLEAMINNMSDAELPGLRASLTPELQVQFDEIVSRKQKPEEVAPVVVVSADETKKAERKPSAKPVAQVPVDAVGDEFKQRVKAMDENTMGDYNSVQAIENTSGITEDQKVYLQKYLDEMLSRG